MKMGNNKIDIIQQHLTYNHIYHPSRSLAPRPEIRDPPISTNRDGGGPQTTVEGRFETPVLRWRPLPEPESRVVESRAFGPFLTLFDRKAQEYPSESPKTTEMVVFGDSDPFSDLFGPFGVRNPQK